MSTREELARTLERMEGRSYRSYRDLRGRHAFPALELFVDHVQGDPFAAPSKVRLRVPMQSAALPRALFETRTRRIALEDFLARRVRTLLGDSSERTRSGGSGGSGNSNAIAIDAGGQEVLERTAIKIREGWVEARLEVGLPARGRRISGNAAARLLTERLPWLADQALHWRQIEREDEDEEAWRFVECVENQEHIRAQLDALDLVAFVGNGAILPRESGASERPLSRARAIPFEAPLELEVRIPVPNAVDDEDRREVVGLGIPHGITLIAGGGYHGKSTLLRALQRCVYPHIPGDGREFVVTAAGAVKIRAEDGRRVECVDIHPFIGALPCDARGEPCSTSFSTAFSTDHASGSTSQAASIVEALEAGATSLLMDEDTSATNFMTRDARMQVLVQTQDEPITPFVDRVRELYEQRGVSTVLVMGSSGDYFDDANHVIVMHRYRPLEATEKARSVAREHPSSRTREALSPMAAISPRIPVAASFDPRRGQRDVKIDAHGVDRIRFGETLLELRGVEQLVDPSQTRAVGFAIHLAARRFMKDDATLSEVLDALDLFLDAFGLEGLDPRQPVPHSLQRPVDDSLQRPVDDSLQHPVDDSLANSVPHPGRLARPRRFEIAAAINRMRSLRMGSQER